jgi:hypothetical protein
VSGGLLGIGLAVVAVVAVILALYFLQIRRRNRRTGSRSYVQHSRLTCPKCQGTFDYTWYPGAALTAVRLGDDRYMACPLCHKWSVFNIMDAPAPPSDAPP